MAKKVLNILETAYRATIEEQDDTVIWFNQMIRNGGVESDLLLRGNAVNYAVEGQDASGLSFGEKKQTLPANLAADVSKFIESGGTVYWVKEDAADRGIADAPRISGLEEVARGDVAGLFEKYDHVWVW